MWGGWGCMHHAHVQATRQCMYHAPMSITRGRLHSRPSTFFRVHEPGSMPSASDKMPLNCTGVGTRRGRVYSLPASST